MAGLGVTVLPKDDSLQRAIADIVAGFNQSQAERARLAQAESQFSRSHDLASRQAQSLIDTNAANVANANMQTLGQRADAITKGLFATADDLAKKGAKPEEIQSFMVSALKNFSDDPGPNGAEKPPALKELNYEVRSRLVAQLTQQPDTPGGRMVRGALETGAAATERAAAGSLNPLDIDWSRKVATGADLSQSAYGDQLQREAGPEQHGRFADIAGGLAPDAEARLQSATQREIAAGNRATQLQIAREGDANARTIAGMRTAATQSPGDDAYKQERRARIVTSVDDLMGRVGYNTVGIGSWLANVRGTNAADFAADLDTLKGNIAFNELKEMRDASKTGGALGSIAVRELELLQSTLGGLDTKQSPANFKKNLTRVRDDVTASIERWQQAKGGGGYKFTATNPQTGQKIGSNDGESWEPIE